MISSKKISFFDENDKFPIISGFNKNANILGEGSYGKVTLVYFFKEMKVLATKSFREERYFINLLDLKNKVLGIEKIVIMIDSFDEDQIILMFERALFSLQQLCENFELGQKLSPKNYS